MRNREITHSAIDNMPIIVQRRNQPSNHGRLSFNEWSLELLIPKICVANSFFLKVQKSKAIRYSWIELPIKTCVPSISIENSLGCCSVICSADFNLQLSKYLLVRFNFNHVCPTRFHCQFEQISWQNETKDFFLSILNDCFIQETLTNFLFHIDLSRNIRDLLLLFDRNPYLTCAVLESNAFSNGNFDGMPSTSSTRIRYRGAENFIKIELVV